MFRYALIGLFFAHTFCQAQQLNTLAADLPGAIELQVNRQYTFSRSPEGFGNVQEFPLDPQRSHIYFKEERNSVWFKVVMPMNGIFEFEITPESTDDDYDWMLFTYKDPLQQQLLIRSNNARNDKTLRSKTGIKGGYTAMFVTPGPGKSYSSPVMVKQNDSLALLVDNIYPQGRGFTISLSLKPDYAMTGQVKGFVKDKLHHRPLIANVALEDDSTGVLLSQTETDSLGFYSVKAPLNRPVNVTASHQAYLFATEDIMLDTLPQKQVDFLLDTIKAGNKLILFNVHFAPNRDEILPNSQADLDRLVKFLQLYPGLNVRLVGHTNNNVFADMRYLQTLSFNRAIAVKKYLLKQDIPENRISCAGMGGKTPLIQTKDTVLGMKNLRVEVVLVGK
ncbi:OmpA family protein (plasmid) [Pedobacter sp. BS3]|uniref:OmpA family protein n=1 Tax=Pedobacter sp. BS3 TaxID=2567937 RepID=UPI0011EBA444|nr:OmpA family protein [Pedobacter sp. BS3]TZF85963.1 OmpA family protein [Pedobacter sp. BS3]